MNQESKPLTPKSIFRQPRRLTRPCRLCCLWVAMVLWGTASHAQIGGIWQPEGPAPNTLGQTENIVPDDEVSGAIHTVVTHPTNADVMWIGAVNGGIWRTDKARAVRPTWVEQTVGTRSLSIGALDLDPTDSTHNTLVVSSAASASTRAAIGPVCCGPPTAAPPGHRSGPG